MTRKEAGYRKKAAELICRDIIRSYLKEDFFITIEIAMGMYKAFPKLSADEYENIFRDVNSELYGYIREFPDILESCLCD